jgi:hypothetical protein
MNPVWFSVSVLDGYLAFAIGTQPGKFFGLTHFRKLRDELMSELNRHRHKLGSVFACVAEHKSLVAGTLLFVQALTFGDALRNIGTLFADTNQDGTVIIIETHFGIRISYVLYDLTNHGGHINDGIGSDFAGYHNHTGLYERFAGDSAIFVLLNMCIENRIRDSVGDLVGMPHRYGFACKEETIIAITYFFCCHIYPFKKKLFFLLR